MRLPGDEVTAVVALGCLPTVGVCERSSSGDRPCVYSSDVAWHTRCLCVRKHNILECNGKYSQDVAVSVYALQRTRLQPQHAAQLYSLTFVSELSAADLAGVIATASCVSVRVNMLWRGVLWYDTRISRCDM